MGETLAMKSKTVRIVALLAAVATSVSLAGTPAGAQTTPAPAKGLGALLGSLLGQPSGAPPAVPKPAPAVAASPATPPPGPATPLAVEQHLSGLRYPVGPIDGVYDNETASAVMAFQKVHGLPRTGVLTGDVANAIMAANDIPAPLVPNSDANKVEVDLTRQVLFLYEGGSISNIIPISSGTAQTPTPTGSYRIIRRATGWETSAPRPSLQLAVLRRRLRHPRLAVGTQRPGVARLHPPPDERGRVVPRPRQPGHPRLRPRRVDGNRPAAGLQVVDHPGDPLDPPPAEVGHHCPHQQLEVPRGPAGLPQRLVARGTTPLGVQFVVGPVLTAALTPRHLLGHLGPAHRQDGHVVA